MSTSRDAPSAAPAPGRRAGFIGRSLRSRLGVRLALAVFLTILAVEAAILVPSYYRYENDLYERLEHAGRAAMVAGFSTHAHARERDFLLFGRLMSQLPEIGGGALYRIDGSFVGTFGHAPTLFSEDLSENARARVTADGRRWLDVVWPAAETGLPLTIVGRLDAHWITAELRGFLVRIAALIMLISVVVAAMTMLVVRQKVLKPIFYVRERMLAAQDDPRHPDRHRLRETRDDEIGDMMSAFDAMIVSLSVHVRTTETARAALAEANDRLEDNVQERTRELVAANEKLRREVAERSRAERQLRHEAFHDRLTQLPNRDFLAQRIDHAIVRMRRAPDRGFTVAVINVDRFRVVTDNLGYGGGGQLIVSLAARFRACLRDEDTLARIGDNAFGVLLENCCSQDRVRQWTGRLREALDAPVRIEGEDIYSAVRVGAATSELGFLSAESYLQNASLAQAGARSNRGEVEFYGPENHGGSSNLLRVEADLRLALDAEDQLILHYQPIVSVADRAIVGFEALLRWQHPRHGLIGPGQFIQLAEETGLILPIGRLVLEQAARQLAGWRADLPDRNDLFVAVNESSRQVGEGNLVDDVVATLARSAIPARNLKLEVTESLLMENPDAAAETLHALVDLGVRLAIDDFGTGYSSLGYLHRFPFHDLKIDRSFVRAMDESREGVEILRAIVSLGRSLGLGVIAEGVESIDEFAILRRLHCGYVQGYVISPAVDAGSAFAMLRRPENLPVVPDLRAVT